MNKAVAVFCFLLFSIVRIGACGQTVVADLAEKGRLFNASRKYDSALLYADSALALNREFRERNTGFKAMRIKGRALFGLKQEKKAIDLYFSALSQCTQPKDSAERAHILGEIGYIYFVQGRYGESKSYYKQEIALLSAVRGPDSIGNQLINLAVMHQSLGEYDSAGLALARVKKILEHTHDSTINGYYLFNMGALYTSLNKPDSARLYYMQAYDIWKALDNRSQLFKVTFNLGYYYYQKKSYAEAVKYYHLAEVAASKYGSTKDVAHLYGTMAETYAAMGDYRNAYNNLYRYASINDSLYQDDINNYILELDTRYQAAKNRETIQEQELELKASKLAVQQQKNTILTVVVVLILVLSLGGAAFVYLNFRNRVQKEVEEAKSRFFANVAHEIRTPLSMIAAPLEAARSRTDDPKLHEQLDLAARSTTRLNELINQMLDISKVESARYVLNPAIGDISDFLEQLFASYRVQASAKGLSINCSCDKYPEMLQFDKDVLEKILDNLVGNAIKYTPTGGNVGVECSITAAAIGAELKLVVWDNGPGIAEGEQELIFDRFYRSKEQKTSGSAGVGIGLSLTRDLVRLMNGTIAVNSEPGKGAVFTVVCPLAKAAALSTGRSAEPAGATVLLVEDDNDILNFNRDQLEEDGYQVWTAINGLEAQTLLESNLPDIVVTDLMMPAKDGLALLQDIRQNPGTSHLPVIILSAKASQPSRVEGISVGAQAYLAKPFSPAELKALIKNHLAILARQKELYQAQNANAQASIPERFTGTDPFTKQCYDLINEHLDDAQLSVERLAELMNINRSHFQRKIKTLTGYSPSELIKTIRLERAKEMLLKKEGNITEVAYATGFTSQSYFTRCFADHFGYPPSQATSRS
ncbi:MAG: response regulator [Taibaiella sp.]|nr:response regulator [Taibaiella sp.]